MSLSQILMLPPGYGFDAAVAPPTFFTLVLDDLLTRHFVNADMRFKLTVNPIAETTGFVELDDNATIYSATDMATDMQAKLEALTGYSGLVTVSGASTEAGDKYTFTIMFDASLGAVTLAFHASSQFYPTITLAEAVTQQGVATVTGVAEEFIVYAGTDEQVTFSDGNVNGDITDTGGLIISVATPSGYTATSGGVGFSTVTFTADATGAMPDMAKTSGGGGSVAIAVQGVTAVTGQPEIHTITPTPVNPTGGYWEPAPGPDIEHHAIESEIESQIVSAIAAIVTASGTLDAGVVTITNSVNGNISDTYLSPVNVSLTAPEITHSIT